EAALGTPSGRMATTTCGSGFPRSFYKCEPNHTPGPEVTTCGDDTVCSLGRCVSPGCAAGEMHASATAVLFYIAILDNVASDDDRPTLIVVTNPGPDSAMVTLQERAPGAPATWSDAATSTIPAGRAARIH